MANIESASQGHQQFLLTPLENGLDFVASAVGYLKGTKPLAIKYAVLHLHAGIELLLKERLTREHWTLVVATAKRAPTYSGYRSGELKSIYMDEAVEKLIHICGVNITSKQRDSLKRIEELRNKLQHHGVDDSREAVLSITAAALNFVHDFMHGEVKSGIPLADQVAVDGVLEKLREDTASFSEFIKVRIQSLQTALAATAAAVVTCPDCRQLSLVVDQPAKCLFCYADFDSPEALADLYVSAIQSISQYVVVKEGGRYPVYACLNCLDHAFVSDVIVRTTADQAESRWICFACGEQYSDQDVDFCTYCGEPFNPTSDDDLVCGDCWSDIINADERS